MNQVFDIQESYQTSKVYVEASAGTGKTRTLCDLFIKLTCGDGISPGLDPEKVLLVTFTNASAEDLTQRTQERLEEILRQVQDHSSEPNGSDPLFNLLIAKHSPLQLTKRLLEILSQIDRLNIRTAHSFAGRIIDSYSLHLGLPIGEGIQIDAALANHIYQQWYYQFSEQMDRLDQPQLFAFGMVSYDDTTKKPESIIPVQPQDLTEVFDPWQGDASADLEQARTTLQTSANSYIELTAILQEDKKLSAKQQQLHSERLTVLKSFLAGSACDLRKFKGGVSVQKALGKLDDGHTIWYTITSIISDIQHYKKALNVFVGQLAKAQSMQQLRKLAKEQGRFDYDSMIWVLHELLSQNPKPTGQQASLIESLQQQFSALMVDETQDLSPIQIALLETIFQGLPQFFMLDPKQSIYSFQGAELDSVSFRLNESKQENGLRRLDKSWRFNTTIQQDINKIFINSSNVDWGEDLTYQAIDNGRPGFFDIQDNQQESLSGIFSYSGEIESVDELLQKINKHITDQSMHYVQGEQRKPLAWSDVAILTRSNSKISELLPLLNHQGIPFKTDTDFNLWDCEEFDWVVETLPSILQHELVHNQNHLIALGILLDHGSSKDPAHTSLQVQADRLRNIWKYQGIKALIHNISVPLYQSLSQRAKNESFNLLQLLAEELGNQMKDLGDLSLQVNRLKELKDPFHPDRGILNTNYKKFKPADAVNVITMHKSKGLEFPLVIVWDPSAIRTSKHDSQAVIQKNVQEENRLRYIALTRGKCISIGAYAEKSYLEKILSLDLGKAKFLQDTESLNLKAVDGKAVENVDENDEQDLNLSADTDAAFAQPSSSLQAPELLQLPQEVQTRLSQAHQSTWRRWSYSAIKSLLSDHSQATQEIDEGIDEEQDDKQSHAQWDEQSASASPNPIDEPSEDPSLSADQVSKLPRGKEMGIAWHGLLEDGIGWMNQQLPWEVFQRNIYQATEKLATQLDIDSDQIILLADKVIEAFKLPLLTWSDGSTTCLWDHAADGVLAEVDFRTKLDDGWQSQIGTIFEKPHVDGSAFNSHGELFGFIDLLVGNHDKTEYFVIDFKSDWIAEHFGQYTQPALKVYSDEQGYLAQARIYCSALAHHLSIFNSKPCRIHSGIWFLRGLSSQDTASGVLNIEQDPEVLKQGFNHVK